MPRVRRHCTKTILRLRPVFPLLPQLSITPLGVLHLCKILPLFTRFPIASPCTIRQMIQRGLLALALLSFFIPSSLWACTCSKEPPGKCPGLQSDDVVFLGTVTDIAAVAPDATPNPPAAPDANGGTTATDPNAPAAATQDAATQGNTAITRYHFHIDERFAGPDSPDIDVFSGGDDGDCGYNFKKGDQYIVYTQQETEGRLFATTCNGTR